MDFMVKNRLYREIAARAFVYVFGGAVLGAILAIPSGFVAGIIYMWLACIGDLLAALFADKVWAGLDGYLFWLLWGGFLGALCSMTAGAICGSVAFPILQAMLLWRGEFAYSRDTFAGVKGAFKASFIGSLAGAICGALFCGPLHLVVQGSSWGELALSPLTGGFCVGAILGFAIGFFYGAFCGGLDSEHWINRPNAEIKRMVRERLSVYRKRPAHSPVEEG